MKDNQEVIKEFNELVNMTASELEKWLKSDDSNSAGWPKETEGGETVGHDSGRKIVEILKSNPDKDTEKYSDDQVQHMRKVVAYCKRHLAQETTGNNEKSEEDLKKTKSYASLKNWGHDFLKAKGNGSSGASNKKDEETNEVEEDNKGNAGDKRKTTAKQSGTNKKQQTQKGKASKKSEEDDEDEEENDDGNETKATTRSQQKNEKDDEDMDDVEEAEGDEEYEEESEEDEEEEDGDEDGDGDDDTKQTRRQTRSSKKSNAQTKSKSNNSSKTNKSNGSNGKTKENKEDEDDEDEKENQNGATPKKGPKKGDKVSWNWGGGQPEGKVLDVKDEETSITTKNGNTVTRKGDAEDPAVVLDAGKSKAIKLAHELN